MKRKIAMLGLWASLFGCVPANQSWQKEAAGVWKISFGSPDKVNLTSELGIIPKLETINEMSDEEFPVDKDEIRLENVDGSTYIRFPLDRDEQIYGLGRIPVYVKDGGIIPMIPAVSRLDGAPQPLVIHYYGTKPSEYRLYDDDGETFDYEKGEYSFITIKTDGAGNASVDFPSTLWSYTGDYTFLTTGVE